MARVLFTVVRCKIPITKVPVPPCGCPGSEVSVNVTLRGTLPVAGVNVNDACDGGAVGCEEFTLEGVVEFRIILGNPADPAYTKSSPTIFEAITW